MRQTLLLAALVRPPQQEDSYAAAYGTREVGAASAYARSWSAGADHESDAVRQEREATFKHEDELIAARADAAAAEDAAAEAVRMRSTPQTSDVEIPQTRSPRNVVHAGGEESAVAPAIDVVDSQAEGEVATEEEHFSEDSQLAEEGEEEEDDEGEESEVEEGEESEEEDPDEWD